MMAKRAQSCAPRLCLALLCLASAALAQNEYYYYSTSPHRRLEHSLALENSLALLEEDGVQQVQKRAVPIGEPRQAGTAEPSQQAGAHPPAPKGSPPSSTASSSSPSPQVTANNSTANSTGTAAATATTTTTTVQMRNLGENGAGQRRIFPPTPVTSSTTSSPAQSTPAAAVEQTTAAVAAATANATNGSAAIGPGDEFASVPKFSDTDEDFNKTLSQHNITSTKLDNHLYYNSTLRNEADAGRFYWVELTNRSGVQENEHLSKSHRRAATVKLSFEFPFYGHMIKNVTIATGGFLYTGDYVHNWLAATQYIAPLMANFDTSISNDSSIRYVDNGTAFTVEWDSVSLQDKPEEGQFTFQATLHKNGDIVFVYKSVPLFIKKIEDDHHPVKVGLSDAYIIDRTIFFVRRKTIYEYHRINFFKEDIRNWTVIYLTALPTCLGFKDCTSCLSSNISFPCMWCPFIGRCSNGWERKRQDWLAKDCDKRQVSDRAVCSRLVVDHVIGEHDGGGGGGGNSNNNGDVMYAHDDATDDVYHRHKLEEGGGGNGRNLPSSGGGVKVAAARPVKIGVTGVITILILLTLVAATAAWILYAYRNPHTTSGQILIRYRPSQWRWRRGEARYTAATIHM